MYIHQDWDILFWRIKTPATHTGKHFGNRKCRQKSKSSSGKQSIMYSLPWNFTQKAYFIEKHMQMVHVWKRRSNSPSLDKSISQILLDNTHKLVGHKETHPVI